MPMLCIEALIVFLEPVVTVVRWLSLLWYNRLIVMLCCYSNVIQPTCSGI